MTPGPLPGFDELYDRAPCGLLLADAQGFIVRANTRLCSWLQVTEDALRGRNLQELLSVGGRIFFRTHLEPLLRMQGSVAEVKLDLRRPEGAPLPVLLNFDELQWNGGKLLQVAVFVAEDRHKYERELMAQRRRAQELAEQQARSQADLAQAHREAAERALFAEKLVGVVSHDIRNPLSVIHMSAVLLDKLQPSDAQRPVIARISRAVGRVQHLVGDLLDFTQARLGQGLTVSPQDIDVHETVAGCVSELRHAFPMRDIRHGAVGPGAFRADPNRISQAVGNLVANAVQHGAADSPITVTAETNDKGCEVRVHNFGRQIPPEAMARLFEPLVQGESHGTEGGIGLGLFIVKEIAACHGGEVRVQSSAEAGTVFTMSLPVAAARPAPGPH
jgi:sigma-B regulation protein RsbU (phosphoserine phosphatase)